MDDRGWMRHALALAARGLGTVWPNPAVGCVLTKDGILVGEGWTQPGGRPHAEVEALQSAKNARGTCAYVTLEPCAHQGKTGPCAVALRDAGVTRVVVALEDPDPRVFGKGIALLRAAGVVVDVGMMQAEAAVLNAGFLSKVLRNRPMITLKMASTLDGRIATSTGESRWITGSEARLYVHHLRATHDAVLIGSGTARSDNPMLNIRNFGPSAVQPVRVVLDSSLSLSAQSKLVTSAEEQPLWIVHGPGAAEESRLKLQKLGAICIEVPLNDAKQLDLRAALQVLAEKGLTRVLCEGGGTLAASLIRAELIDDLTLINAGKMIGSDGVANIAGLGVKMLADAPAFKLIETRELGADIMTRWISATDAHSA